MTERKFLSRGIDYLGDLGAKLRDLQGYRTLAHELIQNADDASTATMMCFDVLDDALVIDNDGAFSDCEQVEAAECPWKNDGRHNRRCDFHRFRTIAAGDKRNEQGTTGAFGIGFIATYQITDAPELISAGRHWTLHEEKAEGERIAVCPGCSTCSEPDLPGTRIHLPWAKNSESILRKALRAEAVPPEGPQRLLEELERSIPIAMLFLKRLQQIVVKRAGRTIQTWQRLVDDESLILSDGTSGNDRIWHLVRGDFRLVADTLRAKHPGRIEAKRSSAFALAVPTGTSTGVLCACLPTEHDVGFPFHINGDFFPTNDRKRIIFAEDYQSEWNREILKAAAEAFANAIDRFPGGHPNSSTCGHLKIPHP